MGWDVDNTCQVLHIGYEWLASIEPVPRKPSMGLRGIRWSSAAAGTFACSDPRLTIHLNGTGVHAWEHV